MLIHGYLYQICPNSLASNKKTKQQQRHQKILYHALTALMENISFLQLI